MQSSGKRARSSMLAHQTRQDLIAKIEEDALNEPRGPRYQYPSIFECRLKKKNPNAADAQQKKKKRYAPVQRFERVHVCTQAEEGECSPSLTLKIFSFRVVFPRSMPPSPDSLTSARANTITAHLTRRRPPPLGTRVRPERTLRAPAPPPPHPQVEECPFSTFLIRCCPRTPLKACTAALALVVPFAA